MCIAVWQEAEDAMTEELRYVDDSPPYVVPATKVRWENIVLCNCAPQKRNAAYSEYNRGSQTCNISLNIRVRNNIAIIDATLFRTFKVHTCTYPNKHDLQYSKTILPLIIFLNLGSGVNSGLQ